MKTLITFFTILTLVFVNPVQETITIKATFEGFEEDVYYFIDEEENNLYFDSVIPEVSEKFNLLTNKYVGKKFVVIYKVVTNTDEFDEEYDTFVITSLKLIE